MRRFPNIWDSFFGRPYNRSIQGSPCFRDCQSLLRHMAAFEVAADDDEASKSLLAGFHLGVVLLGVGFRA